MSDLREFPITPYEPTETTVKVTRQRLEQHWSRTQATDHAFGVCLFWIAIIGLVIVFAELAVTK